MASSGRALAHQLSNGLYVSGRPEACEDKKMQTMASTAMPYTGGDIKKSGELGRMFVQNASPNSKRRNSNTLKNTSPKEHSGLVTLESISRAAASRAVAGGNLKRSATNAGSKAGSVSVHSSRGDARIEANSKPASKNTQSSVGRSNSGNALRATGLITLGRLSASKKVISDEAGAGLKSQHQHQSKAKPGSRLRSFG